MSELVDLCSLDINSIEKCYLSLAIVTTVTVLIEV